MDSHARVHAELIAFLRQHCPVADGRHLTLLGWMVAGLLLSQTVCLGYWQQLLPLHHCLAASWQRRCRRWLSNRRIDVDALYGPLVRWAIQGWQNPDQALHLALDPTVLWNRFCVVVVSVVCHGRAIPLLWQTLEHSSASVSAEVVISLLQRADQLLAGFGTITVLADHGFPQGPLEVCPSSPAVTCLAAVCWPGLDSHRWPPHFRSTCRGWSQITSCCCVQKAWW